MFDNRTYAELGQQETLLQLQMDIEIEQAEKHIRNKYAPVWDQLLKDKREAAVREGLHTPRT